MPNDGVNNQVKNRGIITEGLLKKGGINTAPPTPKPAPPPGQPVQPAGSTTSTTQGSKDKGGS
jgi:hypothetical protein